MTTSRPPTPFDLYPDPVPPISRLPTSHKTGVSQHHRFFSAAAHDDAAHADRRTTHIQKAGRIHQRFATGSSLSSAACFEHAGADASASYCLYLIRLLLSVEETIHLAIPVRDAMARFGDYSEWHTERAAEALREHGISGDTPMI